MCCNNNLYTEQECREGIRDLLRAVAEEVTQQQLERIVERRREKATIRQYEQQLVPPK